MPAACLCRNLVSAGRAAGRIIAAACCPRRLATGRRAPWRTSVAFGSSRRRGDTDLRRGEWSCAPTFALRSGQAARSKTTNKPALIRKWQLDLDRRGVYALCQAIDPHLAHVSPEASDQRRGEVVCHRAAELHTLEAGSQAERLPFPNRDDEVPVSGYLVQHHAVERLDEVVTGLLPG